MTATKGLTYPQRKRLRNKIKALHKEGKSYEDIAEEQKLTVEQVKHRLYYKGIDKKKVKRGPYKVKREVDVLTVQFESANGRTMIKLIAYAQSLGVNVVYTD